MCGFLFHNNKINPRVEESLISRGRDYVSIDKFENYKFQSFRLEVVGGESGRQPYTYKNFKMIFNGEIYNYKDLCAKYFLSDKAARSDGECALELIVEYGDQRFFQEAVGHYAILIINIQTSDVVFFRDEMGVKPLFYTPNATGGFAVSSDINTLSSIAGRTFSRMAALEAVIFGGHTGERTLYDRVFECLPGYKYQFNARANKFELRRNKVDVYSPKKIESSDYFDCLSVIEKSVAEQSTIFVPGFGLISSGIDSRIIKSLLPEKMKIPFYNIISKELGFDESDVYSDNETNFIEITQGSLTYDRIKNNIRAYGTIPAHNNYFVLCAAYQLIQKTNKHKFKVALTGEGADEYFGGYGRYKALYSFLKGKKNNSWINTLRSLSKHWIYLMNSRVSHNALLYLNKHQINIDEILQYRLGAIDLFNVDFDENSPISLKKLSEYDVKTNLRYGLHKQDVSGMLSGIEVRVPFVNQIMHRSACFGALASANEKITKIRLNSLAQKLNIFQNKKIGFPVSVNGSLSGRDINLSRVKEYFSFIGNDDLPEELKNSFLMLEMLSED